MVRDAHPLLHFSSMQINVNTRAVLHVDKGNIGMSAVMAMGRYAGGQLFTLTPDAEPIILDPAGSVTHETYPIIV